MLSSIKKLYRNRKREKEIRKAAVLKAVSDGYDFGFAVRHYTGLTMYITFSTLYSLEGAGLLKSETLQNVEKPPHRHVYWLTVAGQTALEEAESKYPDILAKFPLPIDDVTMRIIQKP